MQTFCGIFAWNMLEYVVLWCSVSCVPLCKGVRCARLCTLFFKSLLLDLFKVYHTFVWLSTKTFELTTMWVCRALTLCCFSLFCWVYLITRTCDCQELFLVDCFLWFVLNLSILYHMFVWLSTCFYDFIIDWLV